MEILLPVGVGTLVIALAILIYIKRKKRKLRRFVLRYWKIKEAGL